MIREREAMLMDMIEAIGATMDDVVKRQRCGEATDDAAERIAGSIHRAVAFVKMAREHEGIPDTMPAGWNRPAPATKEAVYAILRDASESVFDGDSFEGTITWSMPTDEPELQGFDFGLVARYRIGNLDGQGGLRVYTHDARS